MLLVSFLRGKKEIDSQRHQASKTHIYLKHLSQITPHSAYSYGNNPAFD